MCRFGRLGDFLLFLINIRRGRPARRLAWILSGAIRLVKLRLSSVRFFELVGGTGVLRVGERRVWLFFVYLIQGCGHSKAEFLFLFRSLAAHPSWTSFHSAAGSWLGSWLFGSVWPYRIWCTLPRAWRPAECRFRRVRPRCCGRVAVWISGGRRGSNTRERWFFFWGRLRSSWRGGR